MSSPGSLAGIEPRNINLPKEGHQVGEELVEQADTLGSLLSHTQSTGDIVSGEGSTSGRAGRKRLVDEVGVENRRTVVRETLAQLDEGDRPHAPLDLSGDTLQGAKLLLGGLVRPVVLIGDTVGDGDGRQSLLLDVHRALGIVGVDAMVLGIHKARLDDGVVVEVDGGSHAGQEVLDGICPTESL